MTEQKVITITSNTDTKSNGVKELEYPELNKYLEDGYFIEDKTVITLPQASTNFACVFTLRKQHA